ncbi:energy transducer TonB [Sphingomonas swuensis]
MSTRPPTDPRSPIQQGGGNGLVPALVITAVGGLIFWGSQQLGPPEPETDSSSPVASPPVTGRPEPARATANLAAYFADNDYPDSAIRNDEQGTTTFELTVSPKGRVEDCRIASSSGSATLDSTTCRILQERARFRPATDPAGNPVPDTVRGRIRWALPDG